jgi:two-component system response regulator TctD
LRILLAEDAEDLGDAVAARLRASGHAVEWHRTGTDVAMRAREEPFDAIVLDVMLPGRGGFSVLAELRRAGVATPVLVVTARAEVDDKVSLLDLGADDYIVKPFDLREFEARLRAVMRRPTAMRASAVRVGALAFDAASRSVSVDGRPVDCGRREFRLLEVLLGRLGQVVAKERLMTQLFDAGDDVGVNALELVVSRLRRKLEGAGVEIITVRGAGYLARATTATTAGGDATTSRGDAAR